VATSLGSEEEHDRIREGEFAPLGGGAVGRDRPKHLVVGSLRRGRKEQAMIGPELIGIGQLELGIKDPDTGVLKPVLKGISLELGRGEAIGLVGESGSGKSMTLRCILGIEPRNAAVRGRPCGLPCARAFAIPAFTPSRIISRSN